ncbi:[NiFe]-hydrogenase assembly chaperone HybE [Azospirillum halopraeferens]|uniref:[NiFe]-hydrogenase assembly chaperone HybE n=1 Tax=Azospirillum halopraeferens TaxID=34010 RepID=UPI0003FE5F66|nr:[NiFe]-hydrogenase assembly chaperone HybE [Azospirillum halopraeferens]
MTAPPTARFEGSYLGDASRIAATARMECKICWHVYDPAQGCDVWQVPPGTPFAALPAEWRCPVCDGERTQFMTLDPGTPAAPAAVVPAPAGAAGADPAAPERRLEAAFREIHLAQMRGVPIVNEALSVRAVGFRPWQGRRLGALVTPWFLNLVLLPGAEDDWSDLRAGTKELIDFPSGLYEFVHAVRPDVGPYKACSLFSPMFEFTTMLHATETAAAAVVALFDPSLREDAAAPPPEPAPPARPDRRALLLGGGGARASRG